MIQELMELYNTNKKDSLDQGLLDGVITSAEYNQAFKTLTVADLNKPTTPRYIPILEEEKPDELEVAIFDTLLARLNDSFEALQEKVTVIYDI